MRNKFYNLKAARAYQGLTQKDMAKLLGVDETSYNKKENGQVKFDIFEAKKIADYFGKSIEALFFRSDQM